MQIEYLLIPQYTYNNTSIYTDAVFLLMVDLSTPFNNNDLIKFRVRLFWCNELCSLEGFYLFLVLFDIIILSHKILLKVIRNIFELSVSFLKRTSSLFKNLK